ncbi:MAG: S8 family serine peptidase, partial [Natronosporangium sp.]
MLPSIRRRWPVAALLVLAMVAVPGPAGAAATPDPAPDSAPDGATDRTPGVVVTLITGDRVHVQRVAGGRQAVTVDPARRPGAEPWFQTSTYQEQVYVVPSDAARLVPGTLDRELFNVTKLAEAGYTDGVPVIVTGDRPATAGATVTADLPSIDGRALTVAADGQWWRSRSTALAATETGGTAGAERVWLDQPVAATLDESVPLVGAPAAWDAGFDGTGMTVAVLDTGIDASHPDLAGKVVAAENFSEFSDTTTDRFGHGTHVAGIVAGTGAAAGGTYRGVAPGASLMNGKVLGDDGFGLTSDIIEGMQWAVTNGADVVNMSLGGDPSDGTDPLSQAVNQFTAEHGVLFVISAGNQLPADHTVTSPGAADAALTVGSVDKAEQLAFDSGRGPRLGDFAIKPDLTAPGVAIASARADGTALGPIVDEHYTRISGTSMAAPHVAAAAAILLQQDPTLDPATLKAALAATAVPNDTLDVHQQGGGRLDLPAALAAPVRANPSPLDLGYFRFPHEENEPVSADVTYTNRTDAPVTLDLALAVRRHESGPGGPPPGPGPLADPLPPADGMLSVSPATLTVPAGGTATATVTVDVRVGEPGVYGGYLVATRDGAPVTRTPVGFHKEAESYQLTIRGTARDGRPAAGSSIVNVMDVRDTRRFFQTAIPYADGEVNLRVPAGVYSILGVTFSYGDDLRNEQERVFVGDPEVEVTGDTTVELDARTAQPVTVETPDDPGAAPIQRVQLAHFRAAEEFGAHDLTYIGPVIPEYAMATEPVTLGAFEYYTRWRIAEPQLALSVSEPAERALSPWEMDGSPAMDGDLRLPLVDAGLGTVEDYQGLDAEGAVVLT